MGKKAKDEIEKELHQLILNGDDLALSKLFDLYSDSVAGKLKSWYRNIAKKDIAIIHEAVSEAFLGYYRNPGTYDPKKSTLQRFLEVAADRDLLNILSREKKHSIAKNVSGDVEVHEKFWNSRISESETSDGNIINKEAMAFVNKELSEYFDNEKDIQFAILIIAGERSTRIYSAILEIQKLQPEQQKAQVKRHKDRIKKVLERNGIEEKIKSIL